MLLSARWPGDRHAKVPPLFDKKAASALTEPLIFTRNYLHTKFH